MAPNYASIKLSNTFVEVVRREADASHRSVGGQVEYWAKLGRAVENTPGFSLDKVRGAMEGRVRFEVIPVGEARSAFVAQLNAAFDQPDEVTRAQYSILGEAEGAVGSDGKGGVVRRQAGGGGRRGPVAVDLAKASVVGKAEVIVVDKDASLPRRAAGGAGRKD